MTLTNKSNRTGFQPKMLVLLGMAFGLFAMSHQAKAQTNITDYELIINSAFHSKDAELTLRSQTQSSHFNEWRIRHEQGDSKLYFDMDYSIFGNGTSYFNEVYSLNPIGRFTLKSTSGNSSYGTYSVNGSSGVKVGQETSSLDGFMVNTTNTGNLWFATNNTERMRLDASGNLLIGYSGTASGLLHVNGSSYIDGALIFGNSEGSNFGTWGTSSYTTDPTAATLMYDANWDTSNDPEYPTSTYFTSGSGSDDNIGGLSFWGGNATPEWEHILTTYNMRYLKGDMYSLGLDDNLTVGNTLTVTSTSTLGDDLTVTGSILSQNSAAGTDYIQMGHGGVNAYVLYDGVGNLDFRNGNNTYVQMAADGKFGIGDDFDPAYSLEVRGDGYFQKGVTLDSTLAVAGAATIGTSGTNANLTVYGQAQVKELYIDPTNTWADYVFARDYQLRPLSEVKTFIETNGHLPGVKSAEEVATEGYAQTEVNAMLLSKVEELTLYMIDLEAQNAELKQSNEELRAMVQALINLQDQK